MKGVPVVGSGAVDHQYAPQFGAIGQWSRFPQLPKAQDVV